MHMGYIHILCSIYTYIVYLYSVCILYTYTILSCSIYMTTGMSCTCSHDRYMTVPVMYCYVTDPALGTLVTCSATAGVCVSCDCRLRVPT